ncbi:MAG: pyridoxine 5'-phosphate synthase [Deltaproteobacteria bacterium]|nr:pyridoxine 5'-phosphate synthase [Deltaproteobacteria bacterium]
MIRLGVNVDHVATVRQARMIAIPDPVEAALLAERGGADLITVHLREDRRHIQERDVARLRERLSAGLNLEMAGTEEMVRHALAFRPDDACLVPERREELTTEGGLDVVAHADPLREVVARLRGAGIRVSLFVDPDARQLEASRALGADAVELHTGTYCDAAADRVERELEAVRRAATVAADLGLEVHGGHGLNAENVAPIAAIEEIVELNIGHSIVARAIMVGMVEAVREMKALIARAETAGD